MKHFLFALSKQNVQILKKILPGLLTTALRLTGKYKAPTNASYMYPTCIISSSAQYVYILWCMCTRLIFGNYPSKYTALWRGLWKINYDPKGLFLECYHDNNFAKIQARFIVFTLWFNFILGFNFFQLFFLLFFLFCFLSLLLFVFIVLNYLTLSYPKRNKIIKLNDNIYTPTKNNKQYYLLFIKIKSIEVLSSAKNFIHSPQRSLIKKYDVQFWFNLAFAIQNPSLQLPIQSQKLIAFLYDKLRFGCFGWCTTSK